MSLVRASMAACAAAVALALATTAAAQAGPALVLVPGEDAFPEGIAGSVCWDEDGDGSCGAGEPGVAGVRVVLEDGTSAVTDELGRWHLAAVPPRLLGVAEDGVPRAAYGRHVVKLDARTLGPAAGDVRARLVELPPGGIARVDLALPVPARSPGAGMPPPRAGAASFRGASLVYGLIGTAPVGARVVLSSGAEARAGGDGRWTAEVELAPGENRLLLLAVAPDGAATLDELSLYRAPRATGGDLVVPQPPVRIAALRLPPLSGAAYPPELKLPVWAEVPVRIGTGSGTGSGGFSLVAPGPRAIVTVPVVAGDPLALRLEAPGRGVALEVRIPTSAAPGFAAGLLDLEASIGGEGVVVYGRGALHGERDLGGGLSIRGGVDLDDRDVTLAGDAPGRLSAGREPLAIARALDPERQLPEWADDARTSDANPGDARLYGELAHVDHGRLRLGTYRADLADREAGTYDRPLVGVELDARLPEGGGSESRLYGFGAAAGGGPGLSGVPAHDELAGTGGSLFFLRHADVVPGSERLRLEVRDQRSGLPVESRELVRGRDYELDWFTGRVLLARPAGSFVAGAPLVSMRPGAADRPVLVADYLHVPRELWEGSGAAGGRIAQRLGLGKARLSLGGQAALEDHEGEAWRLYGGDLRLDAGPVRVIGEYARSEGSLFAQGPDAAGGFGVSADGGLSYLQPALGAGADGDAAKGAVRVGDADDGVEGFARLRGKGFSDGAALATVDSRWYGGSAWTEGGVLDARVRGDLREAEDPRAPGARREGADVAASLSRRIGDFTPRLEALWQRARAELPDASEGSHASAGAVLDWQATRPLTLRVAHLQTLTTEGTGPGAEPDTFTGGGFIWHEAELTLSVLGGAGPRGPEAAVSLSEDEGEALRYAGTTVDVDEPDAFGGRSVAASGARQRAGDATEVFAEDSFARDAEGTRASRTVGIDVRPVDPLTLHGRYERAALLSPAAGAKEPEPLLRDAGSAGASLALSGARLSLGGELAKDRGDDPYTAVELDRLRALVTAAASLRPARGVGLSVRGLWARITDGGDEVARTVEGTIAGAFRHGPWFVGARYALVGERPLPGRPVGQPYTLHLASLAPAVDLGAVLSVGVAGHAGLLRTDAGSTDVYAAAARPVLHVLEPVELAAEYVRRSAAPTGGSLDAARAEVGYRVTEGVLLALGYNLLGFVGNGVDPRQEGRTDRLYLRAEAWY